jgi:tetratricopeptide (TPR) repeat protein
MSKPYSPSSAPEFATQHDYSDILGISTPPVETAKKPSSNDDKYHSSDSIADPWVSTTSTEQQATSVNKLRPPTDHQQSRNSSVVGVATPEIRRQTTPTLSVLEPPVSAVSIDRQERVESPAREVSIESNTPSITGKDLALKSYERGCKSLAAKNYAQAISAYKIAIEWDPQLAIASSGLAQTYNQIQDYESALLLWDRAIEADATQIDFYYQRALVQKILKNYYQVLADCKHILEQSPDHSSARWLNAVALVKLENYQIALFNLNQHVDAYPQDSNGYCYRGICYERLDQLPEALVDFDRAIALQPNQPVFHHARGRTRQRLSDFQGALIDFNLVIDRKPRSAVYDDRAEVHRCLGNHLEALQDCDRAIELNPRFIEAYFRRGLTYTALGDLELALVNYNNTIDLNPQHLNAHIQRSLIYFRKKDYPRAKQDCQTIKSFNQSCFWSNYILGVVNSLSGLKNNAITNFSKAIEISPNYVSARYHRGIIHHELGDIPKAMADFEQARSIQDRGLERLVDRDESGFYAEGLALYHLGQPEAARTILLLGALAAKRFNNPSFHQLILSSIETLGLSSGDLSQS